MSLQTIEELLKRCDAIDREVAKAKARQSLKSLLNATALLLFVAGQPRRALQVYRTA